MNTNGHQCSGLLQGDLVFEIVGAAFEVHNGIGHGLHEKPYENALVIELRSLGKAIDQQRRHEITYKGVHVGDFIPDLIVDEAVVVDTKVIERITDLERGQMLNYLPSPNCASASFSIFRGANWNGSALSYESNDS